MYVRLHMYVINNSQHNLGPWHSPLSICHRPDSCSVLPATFLQAWRAAMPRVVPFYAIKCNPDAGIVRLLASLGAGFDCASLGEVKQVLDLGVSASRIIFAHPCKRPCDIRYAREHGVSLTTFDTESELVKVSNLYPGFKCVLRIRAGELCLAAQPCVAAQLDSQLSYSLQGLLVATGHHQYLARYRMGLRRCTCWPCWCARMSACFPRSQVLFVYGSMLR